MALAVVVAEDSLLVREGIRSLLAGAAEVEVVAAVGDLDALLAAVDAHDPDVVLTDIRMPPTGTDEGIRAATTLRERRPDIGVVVLSQHVEPAHAVVLLEDGAAGRGYLLKDRLGEPGELVRALREVAAGRSCIDPEVVDAMLATSAKAPTSPLGALTPREREVLALVAEGASNAAIADRLVLTRGAVEKHVGSVFAKLGLPDDAASNRRVAAVLTYLRG